jgi:hypothetical protein
MLERINPLEKPKKSPTELRAYIGQLRNNLSLDQSLLDEAIMEVVNEIKSMYQQSLLNRSEYWHAFAQSTRLDSLESLPESTENGVGSVIENLIERKIEPLLRI